MLSVFSRGQQGEKRRDRAADRRAAHAAGGERRGRGGQATPRSRRNSPTGPRSEPHAAQFEQALRQAGVDPQTLRNFLRANMAWSQIVRARFRATVEITELDVPAVMTDEETPEEARVAYEYMLQPIIFVVPQSAGGGVETQAPQRGERLPQRLQGCDSSLEQAGGMPGVVVRRHCGARRDSSAGPAEALAALEVGGITEPQRVPRRVSDSWRLREERDRRPHQATEEVREELSAERGQLLARRYLRDLRSDAVIEYR